MTQRNESKILSQRCVSELKQTRLLVDFYRIRRKVAYPLPVTEMNGVNWDSGFGSFYPWSIWLLWRMEERFFTLASCKEGKASLEKELEVFLQWHEFHQLEKPDLASGHSARIIYYVVNKWSDLSEEIKSLAVKTATRFVDEMLPLAEKHFHQILDFSVEEIFDSENSSQWVHNIPFIGIAGMALMMKVSGHPKLPYWNQQIDKLVKVLSRLMFEKNYTEGVAYDGYLLYFLLAWTDILEEKAKKEFYTSDYVRLCLEQAWHASVNGNSAEVAEIGDVESREMKYHIYCVAKVSQEIEVKEANWYFGQLSYEEFPSVVLSQLLEKDFKGTQLSLPPCLRILNHTIGIRNNWSTESLTCIASCSISPAGHIQKDAGTFVLGRRGHFLLSDPGYQQYLETSEREYTLGSKAHNSPVINQQMQVAKKAKILTNGNIPYAKVCLDLTQTYDLRFEKIFREFHMVSTELLVVADWLVGDLKQLEFYWHGHHQAGMFQEGGWNVIYLNGDELWFHCLNQGHSIARPQRLKGSRGSLTIAAEVEAEEGLSVWCFSTKPCQLQLKAHEKLVVGAGFEIKLFEGIE